MDSEAWRNAQLREFHAERLRWEFSLTWRLVAAVTMLEVEEEATGDLDMVYGLGWNRDTSVWTATGQLSPDNENVLSVRYLLSPSVHPVHQLVSCLTLLLKVQLQLSDPVLQIRNYIWTVSDCFLGFIDRWGLMKYVL